MASPKVSLAAELAEVTAVLEGAERLAEELTSANRDLHLLAATVGMVRARLVLLRKVVIGAADGAVLLDRRNAVDRQHTWEDPDVLLPLSKRKR